MHWKRYINTLASNVKGIFIFSNISNKRDDFISETVPSKSIFGHVIKEFKNILEMRNRNGMDSRIIEILAKYRRSNNNIRSINIFYLFLL
ncbi:hypothetical protein BUY31_12800 [Staphylococcus cohnii]|nr:hypothetical protein BUY31_12800 [Staphylococcus cohnii]RIL82699.1 hypothetical protein BUY23_12715 [Staphylococcus cohnii]